MSELVLSLLGPPTARMADGTPLPALYGSKCLALLTFLALERRPHAREELAALLWGDCAEDAARASLRQSLHRLHAALGDGLMLRRQTVELTVPATGDVLRFLETVDAEPRVAAGIDVSRFLAGFSVRHAPAFDDWAADTRRALLRRAEHAFATLARAAMEASHWEKAAEWAERRLQLEPLSDEAVAVRLEALYCAGDRGAALADFAGYRERLRRELGCAPSRALLELARRIEHDGVRTPVPRPSAPVESPAEALVFASPLIGREEPWRGLIAAWMGLQQEGIGRVVLVEGEAGEGKSRLAEEFLRWAAVGGGTVLRGRCYDAHDGVPYGPVVEALRGALDAPGLAGTAPEWLAEAMRLLPELRQRFPAIAAPAAPDEAGARGRLFEGIAQVVLALSAERPVAFALDDLHWGDAGSCTLLHFLVRRLEQAPVLWLVTITPGEMEREAAPARLWRVLRSRSGAVTAALEPLGVAAIGRVVRAMGQADAPPVAERFAERVRAATGGNPFHVVELLKTLHAEGLLQPAAEGRGWSVAGTVVEEGAPELPIPGPVHDAVAERIERLPDELREVLVTLAVAAMGCSTDVLSYVHGISRLHAAMVGDELVERRLAVEDRGAYACGHPVVARVVSGELTRSRAHEVQRAIAAAMAQVADAALLEPAGRRETTGHGRS